MTLVAPIKWKHQPNSQVPSAPLPVESAEANPAEVGLYGVLRLLRRPFTTMSMFACSSSRSGAFRKTAQWLVGRGLTKRAQERKDSKSRALSDAAHLDNCLVQIPATPRFGTVSLGQLREPKTGEDSFGLQGGHASCRGSMYSVFEVSGSKSHTGNAFGLCGVPQVVDFEGGSCYDQSLSCVSWLNGATVFSADILEL